MSEGDRLTQDFIERLPDDPQLAFPVYEQHVREISFRGVSDEYTSGHAEREYLTYILAFINFHIMDIGLKNEIPESNGVDFWNYWEEAQRRIKYHAAFHSLSGMYKKRSISSNEYIIPPALKQHIHHHINQISEIINCASINDDKRDVLARKLNAFSEEID